MHNGLNYKKAFVILIATLIVSNTFSGCSSKPESMEKQSTPIEAKKYNNGLDAGSGGTSLNQEATKIKIQKKRNHEYKPIEKATESKPKQQKVLLNVPLIAQNPELKYGCEVTSLTMVLQYAGKQVNKNILAQKLKKDTDPLMVNKKGDIIRWGDPNEGFVGDMTGRNKGYAVHVKPLQALMEQYLPDRTVNLTGQSFDHVLLHLKKERPVVLWTTGDYRKPDRFESWYHKGKKLNVALDLHAVVLVGVDADHRYIYLNDPLSEKKAVRVKKDNFIPSWNALGKQALSYE